MSAARTSSSASSSRVGSEAHAEVEALFAARDRAAWEAFDAEHDCCLEPVLALDEALESELVRARGMIVGVDQPGAGQVRLLGPPVKLSRTPAQPAGAAPALGEHTEAVLAEAGFGADAIAALKAAGAVAGPGGADGAFLGVSEAFFEPLGGDRYRATRHTRGPWDPAHQHAGPPAALLGRASSAASRGRSWRSHGSTYEILRPVPVGELEVSARVVRPGRSVELLEGELSAGGTPLVLVRAWRVLRTEAPAAGAAPAPPPRPDAATPLPPYLQDFGYGHAVELRFAAGAWEQPGPATVWTRLRVAVVAGEQPTGLQRVLAVADSGNGVSGVLPLEDWLYINPELTVHVRREPRGEWICLDAETTIADLGVARSTLSDDEGPVAHGAQALFVAPRR